MTPYASGWYLLKTELLGFIPAQYDVAGFSWYDRDGEVRLTAKGTNGEP